MHYLDNAATTSVCPEAAARAEEVLREQFGNPSSLYDLGVRAEKTLSAARAAVAKALGAKPSEVYFTASGTESNNIALLGAARARKAWGDCIVTTAYEHPSVQNTLRELRTEGFRLIEVKPVAGEIRPEDMLAQVDGKTALVAAMRVNNETGAMIDVAALAAGVKSINRRTAVHCDGVQSFLKEPAPLGQIDTMAVSGHKIHAPKGVGALYVRTGFNLKQVLFGGGQERGIRPGTENVAFAAAMAAAVEAAGDTAAARARVQELNLRLRRELETFQNVRINSPGSASPYILNFSFLGYRSETVLHLLESRGVYVSGGSACSKGQRSHTLTAMGLTDQEVDGGIRVSFCSGSGDEDLDALLEGLREAGKTLMRAYR